MLKCLLLLYYLRSMPSLYYPHRYMIQDCVKLMDSPEHSQNSVGGTGMREKQKYR